MTEQEELRIYRSFLVSPHTSTWTGHTASFQRMMKALAAYSYCRTNGNEGDEYPKECEERTIRALEESQFEPKQDIKP